jgi:hypothetical protein
LRDNTTYLDYDEQAATGEQFVDPTFPKEDANNWTTDNKKTSSRLFSGIESMNAFGWTRVRQLKSNSGNLSGNSLYGTNGVASVGDVKQG